MSNSSITGTSGHAWGRAIPFVTAALVVLFPARPSPVHAAPGDRPSILTVCSDAAPDGLDIALGQSAATHDAVGMTLYDQLVQYRRGSADLVPGLASHWEVSADGLHYTFHLRRGVRFHSTPWFRPSRELDATDVVFSMRRQAAPGSAFGMWSTTGLANSVKAVQRIDDLTVRFTLNRPSSPFLAQLAFTFTGSIVSAEYAALLSKVGKPQQMNTLPIGTGPFMLKSYQPGAQLRLEKNPDYWNGSVLLDQLIFSITVDPNTRAQRLKAGECMIGANIKAESTGSFENSPVRIVGTAALVTAYVAINTRSKDLSDLRLRQALRMAMDKPSLVQSAYGRRASPAGSFLPPSQWSHDAYLVDSFDPDQARHLVRTSGYSGRELLIFIRIGGGIDNRRAAELLQRDWAQIGVKSRIVAMEWGELLRRTARGEHDLTLLSWAGSGDPDDFFAPNLSCAAIAGGGNRSQWCDPTFDALLAQAREEQGIARRSALYMSAQRRIQAQVPLIPTVYPEYLTAVNKNVRGFIPSPLADLDFRSVGLHPARGDPQYDRPEPP